MANVRVVMIEFVDKSIFRAELQVRLCGEHDHWSVVKTIAKRADRNKVIKLIEREMVKLKMRAKYDWALDLDEEVKIFKSTYNWWEN